ncbi:SprT family zinc-dependent metalloprotease [Shewanella canadensis]|uniref:Protein SprT n=1 Tax=Shewanella canadensis TaxID=271096 RepID=A0A431WYA3_9GAMM|nr:SprT family zinc-dependent metalloprotease [Shewanella canadensis]RTR40263.1 SprT family zinc-dependent metalloprotease [Shewanella canadensis]
MFNFLKSVTNTSPSPDSVSTPKPQTPACYKFDAELHTRVAQQVLECYQIAEKHLNLHFPRPQINFKLRGRSAGTAHLQLNKLRFNPVLLAENSDIFLKEVIPHEICHLLAYRLYGKVKPHGKEWQSLMISVFGVQPSTTHSLDTQSVDGKKFEYHCGCGPVKLSIRRHNKVVRGETQYRCRRCKRELTRAA